MKIASPGPVLIGAQNLAVTGEKVWGCAKTLSLLREIAQPGGRRYRLCDSGNRSFGAAKAE